MCESRCNSLLPLTSNDDTNDLITIDEASFQVKDAIPILNELNEYATSHGLDFDLKEEVDQVRYCSKLRVDKTKFIGFPFMMDRSKQNIYTIVWSARERLLKEQREQKETEQEFAQCEWPTDEQAESWDNSVVLTSGETLFILPKISDTIDVNSYGLNINQRKLYKCKGNPSLLDSDWNPIGKKETIHILKHLKQSMNIQSDNPDHSTTNDDGFYYLSDADDDEIDPQLDKVDPQLNEIDQGLGVEESGNTKEDQSIVSDEGQEI